jgi:hypothetical protein
LLMVGMEPATGMFVMNVVVCGAVMPRKADDSPDGNLES